MRGRTRVTGLVVLVLCVLGWLVIWPGYGNIMDALLDGAKSSPPAYTTESAPLPGEPDYPVNADGSIDYWVHNCSLSRATTADVDRTLEILRADHIAETVILCMPYGEVHKPVSYAARFLRYMELGMADGPRRDNGLVFIVLLDNNQVREVHYAVGLGLPALTSTLVRINNDTEVFGREYSKDKTVEYLSRRINEYARSKYEPWKPEQPVLGEITEEPPVELDPQYLLCGCLWGLKLYLLAILLSLPVLAIGTIVTGNRRWARAMGWPLVFPLKVLMFISENSGSGGSGSGGGGTDWGSSSSTTRTSRQTRRGGGGGRSRRGG